MIPDEHNESEVEKPPVSERIKSAIEMQYESLADAERKQKQGAATKMRQFLVVAGLVAVSLLATGCKGGDRSSQGSNEQQTSGFTDNEHDVVQQRVTLKKADRHRMKDAREHQTNEDAKNAADEMHEGDIIQPTK